MKVKFMIRYVEFVDLIYPIKKEVVPNFRTTSFYLNLEITNHYSLIQGILR